jgi:hypothetical protein
MDPIAAVSLAASILTFIDFSLALVKGTWETIEAGSIFENRHVSAVVDDIDNVTKNLALSPLGGRSEHEVALHSLALKCQQLAEELKGRLQKLRVADQGSKLDCFRVALRSMFSKRDVADRMVLLRDYREQVLTRLTLLLEYATILSH